MQKMKSYPKIDDRVISCEGDIGKIHSFLDQKTNPYDWILVKWNNYDDLESFGADNNPGDLLWVDKNQAWLEIE